MGLLKYWLLQLSHLLVDFFAPLIVARTTPKGLKSSKANVERVLKFLHPVASPQPTIRLGPTGDGGYVTPDDLEGIVGCFSPGVSDQAGFELALADKGIRCFLADASVEQAPVNHTNIFLNHCS